MQRSLSPDIFHIDVNLGLGEQITHADGRTDVNCPMQGCTKVAVFRVDTESIIVLSKLFRSWIEVAQIERVG